MFGAVRVLLERRGSNGERQDSRVEEGPRDLKVEHRNVYQLHLELN